MGGCRGGDGPCTDCGECGHSKYDKPSKFMPAVCHDQPPTVKPLQRRLALRAALDELFADYVRAKPDSRPSQVSVLDLLQWSKPSEG